jgi:hypothetical protein
VRGVQVSLEDYMLFDEAANNKKGAHREFMGKDLVQDGEPLGKLLNEILGATDAWKTPPKIIKKVNKYLKKEAKMSFELTVAQVSQTTSMAAAFRACLSTSVYGLGLVLPSDSHKARSLAYVCGAGCRRRPWSRKRHS